MVLRLFEASDDERCVILKHKMRFRRKDGLQERRENTSKFESAVEKLQYIGILWFKPLSHNASILFPPLSSIRKQSLPTPLIQLSFSIAYTGVKAKRRQKNG